MPLHSQHFTILSDLIIPKLSSRFCYSCFYLGQRKTWRTWETSLDKLSCWWAFRRGPVWSETYAVCPEPCAPYTLRKACSLPQVGAFKYGPRVGEGQGWRCSYLCGSPAGPGLKQRDAAGSLPSPCWLELGAPTSTPPQPPDTAASCLSSLLCQQD